MMAASGSGGNNLMTYHEFVAAEQLQQAAEGKTEIYIIQLLLGVSQYNSTLLANQKLEK